jgi:hypothetical protein
MGLSVNRLTAWMGAILRRTETTHAETNWNLFAALGEVLSFPSFLAPDNDTDGALADPTRPVDDPGGTQE